MSEFIRGFIIGIGIGLGIVGWAVLSILDAYFSGKLGKTKGKKNKGEKKTAKVA